MKKVVSEFIAKFGCETGYSGNKRTLYIKKSERADEARRAVRERWPALAFYVVVSEDIPVEEDKEKSVSSSSILAQSLQEFKKDEIVGEYDNPATAAQVDDYLLRNKIDRSAKNPYDSAAKVLHRTKEYVRGRYRNLRDKGLVETESLTQNA